MATSKKSSSKTKAKAVDAEIVKKTTKKKSPVKDVKKSSKTSRSKKKKDSSQSANPVSSGKSYVSGSVSELKKVTWPTRREAVRLTLAVILFSGFLTAFIAILDYIYGQLIQQFIIGS